MKIEYFEQFIALAENLNFQLAAEELFMSQSSLSKHIISLEKELGVELFDRKCRKVKLTDNGRIVFQYAKVLQNDFLSMIDALKEIAENKSTIINIGSTSVMVEYGFLDIIATAMKDDSNLQINVREIESARRELAFGQNEFDLILARDFHFVSSPLIHTIVTEEMVAVLSEKHPLSNFEQLDLKQVIRFPLILQSIYNKEYQHLVNYMEKEYSRKQLKIIFTANRCENILEMAEKNIGIAIMPENQAKFYRKKNIKICKLLPSIKSHINLYLSPNFLSSDGCVELPDKLDKFVKRFKS